MNNPLKIFIAMMLATAVFMSCADDQDATNASGDSASVNTTDTGQRQGTAANGKIRQEPKDMDSSTVPFLALLYSDANQYPATSFVIKFQQTDTTEAELKRKGFGPWYGVKLPRPFNSRNKERLNIHIHGYLTYHDMVAKSGGIRHTVFLKWHRRGANVDSVTVWINPAPVIQTFDLSDPPRPKVPPPPEME